MHPGGPPAGRALPPAVRPAAADVSAFRAVFENASPAFLVLDDRARVLEANPAAAALLGEPRDRLEGASLADLAAPEERPYVEGFWAKLLAEGEAARVFALARRGDERGPIEVRAKASIAPGIHLVEARDGAAQQAEMRLEDVFRRLAESEKLAALGTLVLGVAHEVRTPLTFVANNVFLLQKEIEAAIEEGRADAMLLQSARPHLRDALAGVDRINQLVLELRRFTQRKGSARAPLGLESAVAGAVELFRATSGSRGRVAARLGRTPPVEMDVSQVQQVVLNLLDNAADAVTDGSAIEVETRGGDGVAVLVVRDHGPGIPLEHQQRVFQGFYTTKRHGTGLGLSIVRRIVTQHGGTIELESEPGKGTTFRVTFPAAREPKPDPAPGSG